METLLQDLRSGARALRKSPGFTAVAVLTLALGIGANTAIFSVVQAVVLNPLPYASADRLVALDQIDFSSARRSGIGAWTVQELRARSHVFASIAFYTDAQQTLFDHGDAEVLRGMRVSAGFFDTLGVPMLWGRTFRPDDDGIRRANVIVLSHELWTNRFGADPAIVGRTLHLSEDYRVVGVLPASFHSVHMSNAAESPTMFMPYGSVPDDGSVCRSCIGGRTIGRLKAGVTVAQGQADVARIMRELAREHPDEYAAETTVVIEPLRDRLVGPVRDVVWALFGAVTLVLLIACANVANLQLAQASARRKEYAIRAALGSGPRRLVQQVLTENLLLGIVGAALGVGLALAATSAIVAFAPRELPRLEEIHISVPVLCFALAIGVAAAILFGIGPALIAARTDINATIKHARDPQNSFLRGGVGEAVVVAEVAFAVVLVGATGLLVKSFAQLAAVNAGFNPRQVLTMTPVIGASSGDVLRRYRQLVETVRSVPGVISAGMTSNVPLAHAEPAKYVIEGRPPASDADTPDADVFWVSSDYFRVLEIPLKAGRFLTDRDGVEEPPAVLVSSSLAEKQFGGVEAIGRHLKIDTHLWMTIVGIVGDVRHEGLDHEADQAIYEPQALNPGHYSRLIVRTAGNPSDFERPIRRAIRELDPRNALFHVQPMEAYVASSLAARTFSLTVLGLFGSLALALAAIGICGVYARSVSQRTFEIGIRAALGATPMTLMRSVLGSIVVLLAVGIVIGELMSVWADRLLTSQLYRVDPRDTFTMIATAVVLAGVGLLAGWLPARRAANADPMIALRSE
jgi:putative ABC transport system permease protein